MNLEIPHHSMWDFFIFIFLFTNKILVRISKYYIFDKNLYQFMDIIKHYKKFLYNVIPLSLKMSDDIHNRFTLIILISYLILLILSITNLYVYVFPNEMNFVLIYISHLIIVISMIILRSKIVKS